MMSGYRVEYWQNGRYITSKSFADLGLAQRAASDWANRSVHVIIVYPRTESERTANRLRGTVGDFAPV